MVTAREDIENDDDNSCLTTVGGIVLAAACSSQEGEGWVLHHILWGPGGLCQGEEL